MDAFEQAVNEAQNRRAAPVAEAKKELAGTRAEAVRMLREFESLASRLRPHFEAAAAKFQQAAALGARPLQLQMHLREVFGENGYTPGLLAGAPASFRGLISQIDELTEWQVYQRVHVSFPGLLRGMEGCYAALERLAASIEAEVATLPELIKRAAGVPMAVVAEAPKPAPAPKIETDFVP
jgi:hypothetical protein